MNSPLKNKLLKILKIDEDKKDEFKTISELEEEVVDGIKKALTELNEAMKKAAVYDIGVNLSIANITTKQDKIARFHISAYIFKMMGNGDPLPSTTQEIDEDDE